MKKTTKRVLSCVMTAVTVLSLSPQSAIAYSGITTYNGKTLTANTYSSYGNPYLYRQGSNLLKEYYIEPDVAYVSVYHGSIVYLYDMERNIRAAAAINNPERYSKYDPVYIADREHLVEVWNGDSNANVAAMYRLEQAYDYFADLGWYGFDGKNSASYFMLDNEIKSFSVAGETGVSYPTNACAHIDDNVMQIGMGDSLKASDPNTMAPLFTDLDIIAHEYAHFVTGHSLGWDSATHMTEMSNEALCLMEAYSDILGELADPSLDWKIGTNVLQKNHKSNNKNYSLRNLMNPNDSYVSNHSKYMTFYNKTKLDTMFLENGTWKFYYGGSIITNAAAKMYNKGISADDLKNIWYLSISRYDKDSNGLALKATFSDCRKAVMSAANDYFYENYSPSVAASKIKIAASCFTENGVYMKGDVNGDDIVDNRDIPALKTAISNRITASSSPRQFFAADFDSNGVINATDTSMLKEYVNKTVYTLKTQTDVHTPGPNYKMPELTYMFPSGRYWNGYDPDKTTNTPCGTDGIHSCNENRFYRTILKGYQYYTDSYSQPASSLAVEGQINEAYSQCAGFARMLQSKFFDTTRFIRLIDSKNYAVRVGDHIRVSYSYRGGPKNYHSIFVTGVSGNTFQYEECDGTNCRISVGSGTITKDSSGNVSGIKLNGSSYQFVFVERPVMVGDVNGDTNIDSNDLTALNQIRQNTASTNGINQSVRFATADMNCDGQVNSTDYNLLKNALNSKGSKYYISYPYVK